MRLLSTLFICATAALFVPQTAQAYAPDVFVVCGLDPDGDNFLAMRAGPGSDYRMLERLGPGTVVMDWERRGSWFRVSVGDVNGREGWVYSAYLCMIEDH
ncbi:hypothetical protein OCH239_09665 [Roseivivax halodurans JCM 10272]|uniref:SH3b domain-containing protein n=1 Tax=Roseivivax halodurans JCM 10272 TaxID=1449350 RepID=X7EEA0_9RHOB|nr:SH3 domain-containing protein [Roseivivax halodurans]ETX13536.1 hypothetical protein OCH239_09665 [Roseivivax halodurans JCM 10272]